MLLPSSSPPALCSLCILERGEGNHPTPQRGQIWRARGSLGVTFRIIMSVHQIINDVVDDYYEEEDDYYEDDS